MYDPYDIPGQNINQRVIYNVDNILHNNRNRIDVHNDYICIYKNHECLEQ